jgi:hypothetical protein
MRGRLAAAIAGRAPNPIGLKKQLIGRSRQDCSRRICHKYVVTVLLREDIPTMILSLCLVVFWALKPSVHTSKEVAQTAALSGSEFWAKSSIER